MKSLNKIWGIFLFAVLLITVAPKTSRAQDGRYISDQEFYDYLQPYGTWVYDPEYGNVWVPDADEGFRPYATRGHWVLTEYGNVWVSGYEWGWATFHYGRWRYDDFYGWEWIPGSEWAPAWVRWRHGSGYYGWAPLMPGISISLSFGREYREPDNYWVCAPQNYINRPDIYNYYAPPSRSVTIIRNTTIINNTYVNNNQTYITGPRPQEIRQATHQDVRVYNVNNVSRPGNPTMNSNTINIYRPSVQVSQDAQPIRVVNGEAYKQQYPQRAIAYRGASNGATINHNNASRLAMVAKTQTPDNQIVRENPVSNRPAFNNRRDQSAGSQSDRQAQRQQPQAIQQQQTDQRGRLPRQQQQQIDQQARQRQIDQPRQQQIDQRGRLPRQQPQIDQARQQQIYQQRQQQPQVDREAQQAAQQVQQQQRQQQQAEQVRQQQADQTRQQQEAQQQQIYQQRQQQQTDQARQQRMNQQQQRQQQADQTRQQQAGQQQQIYQQRQQQQAEQTRQQQAAQQQQIYQQRQQQQADQARQQQAAKQAQQRQQQAEQIRQQRAAEQQKQQEPRKATPPNQK